MNSGHGRAPVAITFALPDESRAFTSGLEKRRVVAHSSRHLPLVLGECAGRRVLVIHTGVGDAADCRERVTSVLDGIGSPAGHPALLISSGYAGALRPGIAVGDLILGHNYSDGLAATEAARLLLQWTVHQGALTTQPNLAETVLTKAALAAKTGALAVDMESGWIAAECARAGVPMLSLRVVSDAARQPFPAPGQVLFDVTRQRARYVALPLWLLAHPHRILPFVRFVRGLGPAQATLARALRHLLANLPMSDGA